MLFITETSGDQAAVAVLVALEVRAQTQELPQVLVAPVPQRLLQGLL